MYEKLNKKSIWCMYLSGLVGMIFCFLFLSIFGVVANEYAKENIKNIAHTIIICCFILEIIIFSISPKIRYERYRYCITEEKIDVVEGLIFISRSIVPIKRIHNISINQGPIDRIFGIGKVIVTTAGGEVSIRFLEMEKANNIAEALKNKINDIVDYEENEVLGHGV